MLALLLFLGLLRPFEITFARNKQKLSPDPPPLPVRLYLRELLRKSNIIALKKQNKYTEKAEQMHWKAKRMHRKKVKLTLNHAKNKYPDLWK